MWLVNTSLKKTANQLADFQNEHRVFNKKMVVFLNFSGTTIAFNVS